MANFRLLFIIGLAMGFGILSSGCDLINPQEEVPAYIHVDSVALEPNSEVNHGSISHNAVDAWVTVGGKFVGTFQLPETFPVLEKGKQPVRIRPGIMNNGISNTRVGYPFYEVIRDTLELKERAVDTLGTLKTQYTSNTKIPWQETFEDTNNLTIENNEQATISFQITSDPNEVFEGNNSLKAVLQEEEDLFEVVMLERMAQSFPLSSPVYLEANFNTEIEVQVGLIARGPGGNVVQRSKVVLNETKGNWKKIYINFTDDIQEFGRDYDFRVFFGTLKENSGKQALFLDNLKLVHE